MRRVGGRETDAVTGWFLLSWAWGKTHKKPRGEEALLQRRLAPWATRPSFETRAPDSASALPEQRAPQDEDLLRSQACHDEQINTLNRCFFLGALATKQSSLACCSGSLR